MNKKENNKFLFLISIFCFVAAVIFALIFSTNILGYGYYILIVFPFACGCLFYYTGGGVHAKEWSRNLIQKEQVRETYVQYVLNPYWFSSQHLEVLLGYWSDNHEGAVRRDVEQMIEVLEQFPEEIFFERVIAGVSYLDSALGRARSPFARKNEDGVLDKTTYQDEVLELYTLVKNKKREKEEVI